MPCSCIEKVNELFAPLNGRVSMRVTADSNGLLGTIMLVTEKVNPRGKKPPGLLAKFCPICGTAYTPPETKPMEQGE